MHVKAGVRCLWIERKKLRLLRKKDGNLMFVNGEEEQRRGLSIQIGKIAALESEIQQTELRLADYTTPQEAMRLASMLEDRRAQLERAMSEWESVTQEIEATA